MKLMLQLYHILVTFNNSAAAGLAARSKENTMKEGSRYTWPGLDDNQIIDEMLLDEYSSSWEKCYQYVSRLVHKLASDLPYPTREDIAQDSMFCVFRSLRGFRRKCKLSTWLETIVRSRIIDEFRRYEHKVQQVSIIENPANDFEGDNIEVRTPPSTEEMFFTQEILREAFQEIQQYLANRPHFNRNIIILDMFVAGYRYEEIAVCLQVSAPVVGYVIRTVQAHLREKFGLLAA